MCVLCVREAPVCVCVMCVYYDGLERVLYFVDHVIGSVRYGKPFL